MQISRFYSRLATIAVVCFVSIGQLSIAFNNSHHHQSLDDQVLSTLIENNVTDEAETYSYRIPIPGQEGFDPEAPTIVADMSGEMANTLSYVATAMGLTLWMEREHQVNATVAFRSMLNNPAWTKSQAQVQECFPFTRPFNFTAAAGGDVRHRIKDVGIKWHEATVAFNKSNSPKPQISDFLQTYTKLRQKNKQRLNGFINQPMYLVKIKSMSFADELVERFYDDFRRMFRFDDACCSTKPDLDESVFHFRNFAKEVWRWKTLGFTEIGPNRTANDLFGHLKAGDKVAITSRFDESLVQPYVEAFERRGIKARVVSGQSGVEDFCFLLHAKKELVGVTKSTFFAWAGILGNATTVRAYQANAMPGPRGRGGSSGVPPYQWKNQALAKRFQYHVYTVNTTSEYEF